MGKVKVFDLGLCVGKLVQFSFPNGGGDRLLIMSPSDDDEVYTPAASVIVHGSEDIIKLRNVLNEIYPPK